MIGLPTIVASKISPRSTRASLGEFADQRVHRRAHAAGQIGLAAGVHHHVGDAAHQILAEADLRVHRAGRGDDFAGREIAEMRGDRGRADVESEPIGALAKARQDRDDFALVAQGDGDLEGAGAQRLLQPAQHAAGSRRASPTPHCSRNAVLQAPEIARGVVHVGLADLDIVKAHDRIDLDRMRLGALAHDLAMDLAFRGHVDDEIAADPRLTAEAASLAQGPALVGVALLDLVPRRDMVARRGDRVFGELALGDVDLAASANAAPAANRIEIDAEPARRVEDARAFREAAALARRREDDAMLAQGVTPAPGGVRPRAGPRRPLRPRAPARGICESRRRNWRRGPSPRRRREWPECPRDAAGS